MPLAFLIDQEKGQIVTERQICKIILLKNWESLLQVEITEISVVDCKWGSRVQLHNSWYVCLNGI